VVAWSEEERTAPAAAGTGTRVAYLDNLKVLLVAGVIFGHAWAGYADLGSWTYTDVRETSLGPATVVVGEAVLGPFGLFVMGFFFLVAGRLTPASVDRKGPGRFARDRLVRLGIPLLVFVLVLWPPLVYAMDRATGHPARVSLTDPAHLWFVEVLLLYSLGYAAWRAWRPPAAPAPGPPLRLSRLLALAAAVALGTFAVRLRYPLNSTQVGDLHLWQWPQYLALFGLGVVSARRGWLDPVPDRLRRACGIAAVAGVAAIGTIVGLVGLGGVTTADFFGGWHWAALAIASAEGLLAVTVAVWLLGVAQRRLDQRTGGVRAAAARGAYAAFLVQGHVLVGLALAVRPLALPAEAKAVAVSVLGVAVSFAFGWLLVAGTPLGRLL
jgi:Acyltransferase family